MAFMVLALIGQARDVSAFTCAIRALGGAVVVYIVVSAAGRMILNIFVDAIVTHATGGPGGGKTGSDNAG